MISEHESDVDHGEEKEEEDVRIEENSISEHSVVSLAYFFLIFPFAGKSKFLYTFSLIFFL